MRLIVYTTENSSGERRVLFTDNLVVDYKRTAKGRPGRFSIWTAETPTHTLHLIKEPGVVAGSRAAVIMITVHGHQHIGPL